MDAAETLCYDDARQRELVMTFRLPPSTFRLLPAALLLLLGTRPVEAGATERDDVVWVDETHYYIPLDESVETTETMVVDAMTWRYNGQHVYTIESSDSEVLEWTVPDWMLTGMDPDPDAYFGVGHAIRIDSLGREWLLIAVDAARVAEKRSAYDALVAELFGEEPGDRLEAAWVQPENAGEVESGVPTSWHKWKCTVEGVLGWYLFEPEDDPVFDTASPMVARNRKMMFLASDDGDDGYGSYCSGVMVDDDTILTAAHCVDNPAVDQVWCSMGNLDIHSPSAGVEASCHRGYDKDVAPYWTGPPSWSMDYALVHLEDGPGKGWMPLSAVGEDITEYPDFVRGYPRRDQDCNSKTVFNNALTTDDVFVGRNMMGANGSVTTVYPYYVKWDTGSARGLSGAPHYYCPSGDCGTGHWITGVVAYSIFDSCPGTGNPEVCPTGTTTGPRAAAIRDWVIANL